MKPVPRISTRGYYDLRTGKTLKKNNYYLYPKKDFQKLIDSKELTIMIHGLRNDNAGAIAKAVLARNRLRKLGYSHPVIGFSYDSNTTGAHLIKHAKHALAVGQSIAKKNGRNLGKFIEDFKESSPKTKIRLMGHSLGSQVILSTIEYLAKKKESTHPNKIGKSLKESLTYIFTSRPLDLSKEATLYATIPVFSNKNYAGHGDNICAVIIFVLQI